MIYYFEMDDPDIKEIYVDVPQKYMARLIPKSCEGNIFDYSDGCKKKRVKDYVRQITDLMPYFCAARATPCA